MLGQGDGQTPASRAQVKHGRAGEMLQKLQRQFHQHLRLWPGDQHFSGNPKIITEEIGRPKNMLQRFAAGTPLNPSGQAIPLFRSQVGLSAK